MSAYKFVEDGKIVWAGNSFFYWNDRHRQPFGCVTEAEVAEKAELIQDKDGNFFRVPWLHELPDAAVGLFAESDAAEISDEEYEAIRAVLDEGETPEDSEPTEQETETPVEDTGLDYLKSVKCSAMSEACGETITAGVSVTLSDGESHHFSLTVEDQVNLLSLQALAASGLTAIPYHADGESCKCFSTEDFTTVVTAATAWKTYHESYYNSLRTYINALETAEEIAAVEYGMEIPEQYQSEVLKHWAAIVKDAA